MNFKDLIIEQIGQSAQLHTAMAANLVPSIEETARLMIDTLRSGFKILLCGNGGSAADAQHIAAELVGRFRLNRDGLPAIALTTDTSLLTALGNDFGFDTVFERQVQAIGRKGDLLVAISTSGKSPNVVRAMKVARSMKIRTVALLGEMGGEMAELADISLQVPSGDQPRIQEGQITVAHILCHLVEEALFPVKGGDKRS